MKEANCAKPENAPLPRRDPDGVVRNDIFFPEKGQPADVAQLICFECPVLQQCNEYKARTNTQYGIWAAQRLKGEH